MRYYSRAFCPKAESAAARGAEAYKGGAGRSVAASKEEGQVAAIVSAAAVAVAAAGVPKSDCTWATRACGLAIPVTPTLINGLSFVV